MDVRLDEVIDCICEVSGLHKSGNTRWYETEDGRKGEKERSQKGTEELTTPRYLEKEDSDDATVDIESEKENEGIPEIKKEECDSDAGEVI